MPKTEADTFRHVDKALLQQFASLHDGHGVVTVLAERGETGEAEIRATLRRGGGALSELADEAAALSDVRLAGAAHGLVAALSTGEVQRFRLPQPVATLVTVASHADVVPIARAFDRGRPVGIVDARLDRLRIAEAADGEAHELEGIAFSETGDWSEYRGPARANPVRAFESSSQRERFDKRTRVQRSRALEAARRRVAELARERRWCALVIAGDPHMTGAFTAGPELPALLHVETHLPAWESAGQLVHDLARELELARRRPVAVLMATALVHPDSFASGPEAVRVAIDEGRASTVVVDDSALDRVGEVARHALAHGLDLLFSDDGLGEVDGVLCTLHGASGERG